LPIYGSEAILLTDLVFEAPRIQRYKEGATAREVDLDNLEEHHVDTLMRHTRHE
jgi:hypothetical protein